MKNPIALALALLLAPLLCRASDPWGDFNNEAKMNNIGAYAKDIGGLLGSGTFHTARGLGFNGFDAGFQAAYQGEPGRGDGLMRLSGTTHLFMPWFQAEIGLPLKFDGFIRGFSYGGLTVAGGGLRYALLDIQDARGEPQLLLVGDGESFTHQSFSGSHFGLDLVASAKYGILQPYIGAGADRTRLVPTQATGDPSILGGVFVKYGARGVAGLTIKVFPFSYLNVAAQYLHGTLGFNGGFGVRF